MRPTTHSRHGGWPALAAVALGSALAMPALALPSDPTTYQTYPCAYSSNPYWNYGGDGVPAISGYLRWPSSTCDSADGPPSGRPIVVFTHGNGMTKNDHDYLFDHLAKNGFVVASLSNGAFDSGSNEGRAQEAISFLNSVNAFWTWKAKLSGKVAFVGHSRGGEAAVTAARMLADNPGLGHLEYDVRAVVSIAPTDGGNGGDDPKETLDGTIVPGFLAIYGSRDPDVNGEPIEPWPTSPERTAFAIYDRAGSETSVEGVLNPAHQIRKAMVFLERANHVGFTDEGPCPVGDGTLSCTDHRNVALGYINAFLRLQVWNQADYRAFFDGTARPAASAAVVLTQQFSDIPRRVIDNFEHVGWSTNTMGGSVTKSDTIAVLAVDELQDMDPAAPHDTRGMRIKWNDTGLTPYVRWTIPAANLPFVGAQRNVSTYTHLGLRVGQNYDDAWNTEDQAQDFHVRLYTGAGWSSKVKASDYGSVPYPYVFNHLGTDGIKDLTMSALETIRIPLSAFGVTDLTDLRYVYFYFDVPGFEAGSVQIDSLELVK